MWYSGAPFSPKEDGSYVIGKKVVEGTEDCHVELTKSGSERLVFSYVEPRIL